MSMFTININIAKLRSYQDAESLVDQLKKHHDDMDIESASASDIALLVSSLDEVIRAYKDLREDLDTLYSHAFQAEENIGEAMTDLVKKDEDIWF